MQGLWEHVARRAAQKKGPSFEGWSTNAYFALEEDVLLRCVSVLAHRKREERNRAWLGVLEQVDFDEVDAIDLMKVDFDETRF